MNNKYLGSPFDTTNGIDAETIGDLAIKVGELENIVLNYQSELDALFGQIEAHTFAIKRLEDSVAELYKGLKPEAL